MELTPEHIQEFEAIADYSQKLKWWQERFGYDLTPHGQNMTIVPHSIEETKLLIDWYEVGFINKNGAFKKSIYLENLKQTFKQKETEVEKIDYLRSEIKRHKDWYNSNKAGQEIQYGFNYEHDKDTALKDFQELCDSGNHVGFLEGFFNARYCGRLLDFNISQLEIYQAEQSSNEIKDTTTPKIPEQTVIKLKWNTNNSVLYDLFAQLSLINNHKNQSIIGNTIANLALFLSQNVEDLPTPSTIESEILRLRNKDANRPKKNTISLIIRKE